MRLFGLLPVLALAAGIAALPARAATGDHPRSSASLSLENAGPFLLQSIKDKVDGRWGKAWSGLYPFHQHVVSRPAFVRCESSTPFPAPLRSMSVVRVRRVAVHVPGLVHPVAGVAVTMHVELTGYGPRDPIRLSPTFHLVPVHGHWTWLLSAERYRLYTHGGCGSPASSAVVAELEA